MILQPINSPTVTVVYLCVCHSSAHSWVWCSEPQSCGDAVRQCWLKANPDPLEEAQQMRGLSDRWTRYGSQEEV